MRKNIITAGAAIMLAAGMMQAAQINTNVQAANVGKPLPRFDKMCIEQPAVQRAPMMAMGDVIAHWPLTTFAEMETLASMTIIDVNGDDVSWSAGSTGTNLNVMCRSNADQNNDDWLITTPLTLEAGKRYQVSVQLRGRYADNRTIEIKAGKQNTAEAMTISVVEQQTVPTDAYHMFKGVFTADADGDYYIGFHDISPAAGGAYLYLADIIVTEAAPAGAPAAVDDLTVTPGANAALAATVKFTVPTLKLNGEELTTIDHTDLLCNGEVVKTWTDLEPGQPVRYLDRPAAGGSKTYAVAVYNEAGSSELAETTVWVGYDIPGAPTNVTLSTDANDQLQLAWTVPAEGYNGYIFDPEQVWFKIYSTTTTMQGSTLGDVIYTTQPGVTTHQLGQGIDEGEQRGMNCWAVSGVNESGEGPFQGSNYLLTGAPYELPFEDDFANAEPKTFWTASGSGLGYEYGMAGCGVRYLDKGESGGAIYMQTFFADTIQAHSFKISLKDSKLPKVKFKRSTEGGELKMLIIAYNAGMTRAEVVYEETIAEPNDELVECEASLDAFKDEPRYIQLAFTAIDPDFSNMYKYLNVTDIVVYDAGKSAIDDINADRRADDTTVYSIDGRVLGNDIDALPRGIYIRGGKKILK